MIEELQAEAEALLAAGEYEHALAAFSVLREVRARREGPYSTKYLSNLHDCVRCMSHLQLWMDANYLCSELHGKYVRTHGRGGEADTVDVAKHWAWALVNLHDYPPAIRLYLMTADALWEVDPGQAQRLLGAAVIHRHDTDPPGDPHPPASSTGGWGAPPRRRGTDRDLASGGRTGRHGHGVAELGHHRRLRDRLTHRTISPPPAPSRCSGYAAARKWRSCLPSTSQTTSVRRRRRRRR